MSESSPLQAGQAVGASRFTLVRALGRGGMGEVWLAQDERLGEPVALKSLPPEVRADPVALDDLRRETARSHRLTHPNIVRIHDLHEEPGGLAFIAMEYVDGPTLSALRLEQPDRVLAWDLLKPLVEQLCAALDYAHGEKVLTGASFSGIATDASQRSLRWPSVATADGSFPAHSSSSRASSTCWRKCSPGPNPQHV
jgi:hypothetical protein